MPICIDCHAHFLPDDFVETLRARGLADARKAEGTLDLDQAVCGYAAAQTRLPYFPLLYDVDQRVALAERQGIDRQILCLPPFYFAYRAYPELATEICRRATTRSRRSSRARRSGLPRSRRFRSSRRPPPSSSCGVPSRSWATGGS